MLADRKGEAPLDASGRAEVVLEVHSTLRRLSAEYRRRGRAAKGGSDEPPHGEGAAVGRH